MGQNLAYSRCTVNPPRMEGKYMIGYVQCKKATIQFPQEVRAQRESGRS